MSVTPPTSSGVPDQPAGQQPVAQVKLLDWLPWEKILIWGLFILAVYTLRHFFFIIFVTFIVTYIMRSSVRRISRFVLPKHENVWFERILSIAGFILLLFGLYAGGNYLGPELYSQGQALIQRATTIEPEKELNNFIQRTVGVALFYRTYGGKDDPRYQEKFKTFEQQGPIAAAFESFPELAASIEKHFDSEEAQKIESKLTEKEFEAWFVREKSAVIFEKEREALITKWESRWDDSSRVAGLPSLEELKSRPDYAEFRDPLIRGMIFRDIDKGSKAYGEHHAEWKAYVVQNALVALKSSPSYTDRFREFYERLRTDDAPAVALPEGKPPYTYEKYLELKAARERGEDAFAAALQDAVPADEKDRVALAQVALEQSETKRLVNDWLKSEAYLKMRAVAAEYMESGLKSLAGWAQATIGYLITLPIQIALSLLLSFFITLDIPRIRRGILSLKQSRVEEFYEEIAPGLYNFGRLIGRAFQAQGVIALFNTLLTFIAVRALQIQNETFLCAIVFVCSFIPVLGVVLSSVPIAIMSIVQPGGSIFLALQAIGAILIIHFIETSVLNPKILGEMLHLHPVMVLAVLAIGEHFFGVWGLLLGVPVMVFVIRCVILNEEIPGLIEQDPLAKVSAPAGAGYGLEAPARAFKEAGGDRRGEGVRKDASKSVPAS